VILPIDTDGHLRLEAPSGRILDLVAEGRVLRLEVPGRSELRALTPRAGAARSQLLHRVAGLLSAYDLTLRLESRGRPFFTLGAGVRPNWLSRLLGVAPARTRISALALLFRS
jgi:hypothetical protein